jgi:hypothetical protein
MVCDRCGAESPAMKTCRWRDRDSSPFVLCDRCHEPISSLVWIVPGSLSVTAKCVSCGVFGSVAEFSDLSSGEPKRGLCRGCKVAA